MPIHSPLTLASSASALVAGFNWAKTQALAYTFPHIDYGDPVGDWYEAALPGREAFCMRDVAHQSSGAHLLGLAACNRNMLSRFAENISAGKDWCTYWEIDRRNLPCPADYRDDQSFWYNLPANFDLLHCCYRQYLWTGDRIYLDDPALRFFYAKSMHDYIARWDRDGDGIPDHLPADGERGIGTYNEVVPHPRVGGDLIAAQYGATVAYAHLLELTGSAALAIAMRGRAQALKQQYNTTWWDDAAGRFCSFRLQDDTFCPDYHGITNFFPLYVELVEAGAHCDQAVADVIRHAGPNVEERAYLPEILYRYGQQEAAFAHLMEQLAPDYARREYPEVSFCAISNIAVGLLGLTPDASERTLHTLPRLTDEVAWVELGQLPLFDNLITVRHHGQQQTTLTNQQGRPFYWRAAFPGTVETLAVDGVRWPAAQTLGVNGQQESSVVLRVERGAQHTVRV